MKSDARDRAAWEYPVCPRCETDVFVSTSRSSGYGYVCHFCETMFNAAYPASKRGHVPVKA